MVVVQCPCGQPATRRWPRGARPRSRVMLVLAAASSMKTSLPAASCPCSARHSRRASATSARPCSAPWSVFIIRQPEAHERLVHSRHRAGHRQLLLDLRQGQVGLRGHQRQEPFPVLRQDPGFPPGAAVAVPKVVCPAPLLQELLNHADRLPEAPGDLLPGALPPIIGRHDSLPQILRQRSHPLCMDLSG